MGWIVSFVGQKGGTGKSGLCQALGVEAAKNGASVLIADLDEAQRTSFEWGEARALNNIEPPVKVVLESRLKVLTLADQCELLAVDAPGWADEFSIWLAKGSHLTVLPSKPTVEDLRPTIRLKHEMLAKGIEDWRVAIALNEVLSDSEVTFAHAYLKDAGFAALPGFMRTVKSYRDARKVGKAVTETLVPSLNKEAFRLIEGITNALENVLEKINGPTKGKSIGKSRAARHVADHARETELAADRDKGRERKR